MTTSTQTGFILTRQWRDTHTGTELIFWLVTVAGPLKVVLTEKVSVAFVEARHRVAVESHLLSLPGLQLKELELKTFLHAPVLGIYARKFRLIGKLARALEPRGIPLLEADVRPHERYLMERFITAGVSVDGGIGDEYDKMAEIERRYQEDKPALATYNIRDCELVLRIFEKAKLLEFVLERAQTTGLQADHFGGSIAAFSHHYLPRLRIKHCAVTCGDEEILPKKTPVLLPRASLTPSSFGRLQRPIRAYDPCIRFVCFVDFARFKQTISDGQERAAFALFMKLAESI